MKVLGIIGGIGPESTLDYYRQLVEVYRSQKPDGSYPAILINSIDAQVLLDAMKVNDLPTVVKYISKELERLGDAGADFGIIAANTPHIVFDDLRRHSPIPLLSIVEATCDAAIGAGLECLGLIGTRYTMQARFYPEVFARKNLRVAVPSPTDQEYIHEKYLGELFKGIFLPETRSKLLAIAEKMKLGDGIQGLILGGTELPLILREESSLGIPFLDTTQIHVKAAVAQLLA
jgi:aspartate racemase